MLFLDRKIGEKFVIGDDIVVEVLAIRTEYGKKIAKLGFEAPRSVSINRAEVAEAIARGDGLRPLGLPYDGEARR